MSPKRRRETHRGLPGKVTYPLAFFAMSAACLVLCFSEVAMAERKIGGTIKDKAGNAVAGVLVKAFDQDGCDDVMVPWIDQRHKIKHDSNGAENDLMGSDTTDSDGKYEITYTGANAPGDGSGHWDPCMSHGDTRWRPDIYITVEQTVRGKPTRLGRSEVRGDWRTMDDLTINLPDYFPGNFSEDVEVNTNQKHVVMTGFDPRLHGFRFPNEPRNVCVFPTCKEENIGFLSEVVSFNWALCGGMSFTAMKRYLDLNCNNYSVPLMPDGKLPAALKQEIVQNQTDTLTHTRQVGSGPNLPYASWFLDWQSAPDMPQKCGSVVHSIGYRTKGEWSNFIKPELDKKLPVVIGLIYVASHMADFNMVTKNHQVLAVGYIEDPYLNEVTLLAYDPNFPGGLTEIRFNHGAPNSQLNIEHVVPFRLDGNGNTVSIPAGEEPRRPPMALRGFFMNMRTGLSSWPHGNKVCRADVKMDSVSASVQGNPRVPKKSVVAAIELSSVVIPRTYPTDMPVSDLVPMMRIDCGVQGAGVNRVRRQTLTSVFYDENSGAHRTNETVSVPLGAFPVGRYSLSCNAVQEDRTNRYRFIDPNIGNNSKAIAFDVKESAPRKFGTGTMQKSPSPLQAPKPLRSAPPPIGK